MNSSYRSLLPAEQLPDDVLQFNKFEAINSSRALRGCCEQQFDEDDAVFGGHGENSRCSVAETAKRNKLNTTAEDLDQIASYDHVHVNKN